VSIDRATISTIHSLCRLILTVSGEPVGSSEEWSTNDEIIRQAVNDRLVRESTTQALDEGRVRTLVQAALREPLAELWYSSKTKDRDRSVEECQRLACIKRMVEEICDEVRQRSRGRPSFDELIRRAEQAVAGTDGATTRSAIASRFSLAFVDEAQDTDRLQWRLLRHVWPDDGKADGRCLVAVGDPKQAIYSFRGADVSAYLARRDAGNMSTLAINYRSDGPVVDAMNELFGTAPLGPGIEYRTVRADLANAMPRIRGVGAVEALAGSLKDDRVLADAAVFQVCRLLDTGQLASGDTTCALVGSDIAVLVDKNATAVDVQRRLTNRGVHAVVLGGDSVFDAETAADLRILLEALERHVDAGHVRKLATTAFFGLQLTEREMLPREGFTESEKREIPDRVQDLQNLLAEWREVLYRQGIAALGKRVLSHPEVISNFVKGALGERRLTDMDHILELLHERSNGAGTSPLEILRLFDELHDDETDPDRLLRRVEGDRGAVQVMTIHKSKGLEFRCVVVASRWKKKKWDNKSSRVAVHYAADASGMATHRRIDIGTIDEDPAQESTEGWERDQQEEQRRLLYVALTRGRHHVSFAWDPEDDGSVIAETLKTNVIDHVSDSGNCLVKKVTVGDPQPPSSVPSVVGASSTLAVAPSPGVIEPSRGRLSFSGIVPAQHRRMRQATDNGHRPPGSGYDEQTTWGRVDLTYAPDEVTDGIELPMARIPGGLQVGKVLHKVYELVRPGRDSLDDEVRDVCTRTIRSGSLLPHIDSIRRGVVASMTTPLGDALAGVTLDGIAGEARLSEMRFDFGLPEASAKVLVSDVGRVLAEVLPPGDDLSDYATMLAHESFDIPASGVLTGSIDALLQLGTTETPALWITDYKSNRLDRDGDARLIDAYDQDRMRETMVEHHYPLQAILYGVAVYRYLRRRMPHLADPASSIRGFSYFFVRGMAGSSAPCRDGRVHGVYTWQAPTALWPELSDHLGGRVR
jgi:exodeoxyribonuclease V beta subunit